MSSQRPSKRPSSSISPANDAADSVDIEPHDPTWMPDNIERRPAATPPTPNAWVPLCGNMTGDLWHCAAATILWEYQQTGGHTPAFTHWCPDTALIVWDYKKDKPNNDQNTSILRGVGTYEYMRSIGIVPTVVAMRGGGSSENFSLGEKLVSTGIATRRATQRAAIVDFWTRIKTEFSNNIFKISGYPPRTQGPENDSLMFPLWASTAVVMQLINNIGTASALKILGHRFSLNMDEQMIRIANVRVRKLVDKMEQVKREQGVSKVLIFLYRKGDLNGAHDSNDKLLGFVRDQARSRGIGVIIIPQMGREDFATFVPDFIPSGSSSSSTAIGTTTQTPFNSDDPSEGSKAEVNASGVTVGDAMSLEHKSSSTSPANTTPRGKKPKKDAIDVHKNYYFDIFGDLEGVGTRQGKQMTAYIWSLIARTLQYDSQIADEVGFRGSSVQRDLVGVIGGRSGSLDLASFVGVHCMSWTEPLFKATQKSIPGPSNYYPAFFNQQGPQICRLLNQAPIMRVCYLDATSRDPKLNYDRSTYSKLDADPLLTDWLDNKGANPQTEAEILRLIPTDVQADSALALLRKYLPSIEKDSMGIQAIWLRKLIARLGTAVTQGNITGNNNSSSSSSSSSAPQMALPHGRPKPSKPDPDIDPAMIPE